MTKRIKEFLHYINRTELANVYYRAIDTANTTDDEEQAFQCREIINEVKTYNLL